MKKIIGIGKGRAILTEDQQTAITRLATDFRGIDAPSVRIFVEHVSGKPEFSEGFEQEWGVIASFAAQLVASQMLTFARVMTEARAEGFSPWAVKNAADGLACAVVDHLFKVLADVIPGFEARVIASEGVKDGAPGIRVGAVYTKNGHHFSVPDYVISVDPIDATNAFVAAGGGATSGFSIQRAPEGHRRIQYPDPLSVFSIVTGPHVPALKAEDSLDPKPSKMADNIRKLARGVVEARLGRRPSQDDVSEYLTTAKFAMMHRAYQNRFIADQLELAGCEIAGCNLTEAFDREGNPDLKAKFPAGSGKFSGQPIWKTDGVNFETQDGRLVLVTDGNWTMHLSTDYLAVLGNGGLPEFVAMSASASNFVGVLVDKDKRDINRIESTATHWVAAERQPQDTKQWFGLKSAQAFVDANPGMQLEEAWNLLGVPLTRQTLQFNQGFFTATALTSLARQTPGDIYPVVHPSLKGAALDTETSVVETAAIVASTESVQIVSAQIPLKLPQLKFELDQLELGVEKVRVATEIIKICFKYGLFEQARTTMDLIFMQIGQANIGSLRPPARDTDDQSPATRQISIGVTNLMQTANLSESFLTILNQAARVIKSDKSAMEQLIGKCDSFLATYHNIQMHEIGGQVSEIRKVLQQQVASLSR